MTRPYNREKRRAFNRAWAKAKRDRWRQLGLCVDCGKPCGLHRFRGKPYARCLEHRVKANANSLAYLARQAQGRHEAVPQPPCEVGTRRGPMPGLPTGHW